MTIDEIQQRGKDVATRLDQLAAFLKIDDTKKEIAEIEQTMSRADFWDDKEAAQATVQKLSACKNILEPFNRLRKEADDFLAIAELAQEDESFLAESDPAWKSLQSNLEKIEIVSFLSGKFDRNDCYFYLHAGAGGTESCDWANILFRMYRRWFERKGFRDEIIDMQPGDEAGIKSAVLKVSGEFAYGYLRAERGVHRLVRISPFDANARRHTSFASVEVFPDLQDDIDIEIDEKDLRIDTYRASGAGGQYVNRTDSAVRITHLPTGIVVACQVERSQHKNRAMAMKMLKARLYELEEEKRKQQAEQISGAKTDNSWGNQIRSYVLQPYQMVKDLRTGVETGNTAAVLDGEIDPFIEAWLRMSK